MLFNFWRRDLLGRVHKSFILLIMRKWSKWFSGRSWPGWAYFTARRTSILWPQFSMVSSLTAQFLLSRKDPFSIGWGGIRYIFALRVNFWRKLIFLWSFSSVCCNVISALSFAFVLVVLDDLLKLSFRIMNKKFKIQWKILDQLNFLFVQIGFFTLKLFHKISWFYFVRSNLCFLCIRLSLKHF